MGLSRRQRVALKRSRKPINIWYGSVRSGKTHASLWDLLHVCATAGDEGLIVVVAGSLGSAWRNIFHTLLTKDSFAGVRDHIRYRKFAPTATIFGREVIVIGASNEAAWERIQGSTILYCLGDEAVNWPRSFWDMLISRLSLEQSRILVTCNPGTSNHYLKTEYIDGDDQDVHVEKMLLRDNPTVPRSYVERLRRIYTGLFYRRMVLAEWVAAQGAVFAEWDPGVMVVDEVPDEIEQVIAVGIDYGTNHPTAGYALALAGGRLYIIAEWSPNISRSGARRRLTDGQLADSLEAWLKTLPMQPRFIYADPSAASFHEELRSRRMKPAPADNSALDGIRTVDNLLTNGALRVLSSCRQLIDEIPGYRWDPKATERGTDAPIKEADDHVDALRYAVYSCRHIWRRRLVTPPPAGV